MAAPFPAPLPRERPYCSLFWALAWPTRCRNSYSVSGGGPSTSSTFLAGVSRFLPQAVAAAGGCGFGGAGLPTAALARSRQALPGSSSAASRAFAEPCTCQPLASTSMGNFAWSSTPTGSGGGVGGRSWPAWSTPGSAQAAERAKSVSMACCADGASVRRALMRAASRFGNMSSRSESVAPAPADARFSCTACRSSVSLS
mmetsp:Transcript_32195/g.85060  ORF Transcript_32195/g.85060 Transcript_32195/m.85060 type:complete len:200 (-) Transcript_32195:221-820(-)